MLRKLFWIITAIYLGFASQAFALESGTDCAEGADEDLVAEDQTAEPAKPPTKPVS